MPFTTEQVYHVAKLARLQITKQEMEGYYGQVPRIVEYVSNLQNIDMSNAVARAANTHSNVMRDDEITRQQGPRQREMLLACSPHRAGDYIAIPAIFD